MAVALPRHWHSSPIYCIAVGAGGCDIVWYVLSDTVYLQCTGVIVNSIPVCFVRVGETKTTHCWSVVLAKDWLS